MQVSPRGQLLRREASLECGAFGLAPPTQSVFGVRRFISAFKSHVSFILGFAWHQEQASCPEGSEHRASGQRMAPGDVAHVPRPPSPVAEAGPVARHFRPRARLRRLLVRLRRPTLHRSLRSLRQRGFAHYVRLRHYRSSLFCCRKIIPSHSFAALTALIVRRVKGFGDQPSPCLCWTPRDPEGCRERTRQRHLAA